MKLQKIKLKICFQDCLLNTIIGLKNVCLVPSKWVIQSSIKQKKEVSV